MAMTTKTATAVMIRWRDVRYMECSAFRVSIAPECGPKGAATEWNSNADDSNRRLLQLDRHFVDFAGALVVAFFVVLGYWRGVVLADVGCLVPREHQSVGVLNPPFGRLLAVDENRSRSTFAEPAAVINELIADRSFARRQGQVGGDRRALKADPVVAVRNLSAL